MAKLKRAFAALLIVLAPMAAADDAEVAKGLDNLREFFAIAQGIQVRRSMGMTAPLNPPPDPWGTPYLVDIENYRIVSAGSDRKFDEATWQTKEQFAGLEGDVVFANGNFVRTNHNWLCARTARASAQLDALRNGEYAFIAMSTDGMRKMVGQRITVMTIEYVADRIEGHRRATGSLHGYASPGDTPDAWGTPLRIEVEGVSYRIASAGADRRFEPATWVRPSKPDPAEDIVYSDGRFTRKMDETEVFRTSDLTAQSIPQPPDRSYSPAGVRWSRIDKTVTAPVVLERVEPEYPEGYRMMRISGIVILELAITETGKTENFGVIKSLGPAIDMAAVDAVKKWKFQPATRDGKPIPVLFNLTINFKLK